MINILLTNKSSHNSFRHLATSLDLSTISRLYTNIEEFTLNKRLIEKLMLTL